MNESLYFLFFSWKIILVSLAKDCVNQSQEVHSLFSLHFPSYFLLAPAWKRKRIWKKIVWNYICDGLSFSLSIGFFFLSLILTSRFQEDKKEGMRAFLSKRKPNWKNQWEKVITCSFHKITQFISGEWA